MKYIATWNAELHDAIFMGQWNESNINPIVHVLDCFHRASGLRINMSKSKLMGISVDANKVDKQQGKLVVLITPFTYLGSKVCGLISSLWARVIKAIHEEDGKIGKKAKSSSPSIWLDIVHEVELFKERGTDLVSFIHKKLGNGANTSFWEDGFDLMLAKVEGTSLVDMRDRWVWSLEGSGEFFVASVRKLIDDNMLSEVASKTRWIKTVPIKVNVHAWKVKLDCLPTRLNISCRGIDIESILCPMCGDAA
ncbi:RNA-directed DNA polymerase, eukaryota, reverse transcriptase zinc-binding domain protein [Tanacetum coccineum]